MASSTASAPSRSRRKSGPTAKRPPTKKRFGCEVPRIYTKPLRKLEPRTPTTEKRTLGYSVIDFAEQLLELELLPWQKWLLIHMLELLPDNSLRFRTVIVLVARQNGKSTLSQIIALWFMYVYGVGLVIGTAQDLDVAEEIWQGAVDLAEESEELAPLIDRVIKVNGKKALELTKGEDLPNGGGQRYKVKAANRRAGRGLSGDVILLDELREHQSWDAWGAITKTTMARAMALVLALSNAGDATSIVLRYLRQMCIKSLIDAGAEELRGELDDDFDEMLAAYIEDGVEEAEAFANGDEDDSLGIFEWSAPPGCDIRDRDGWAQANPSLGYTITERTIASAVRTDPEWIFRTEVLCQWSHGSLEGPFPPGAWEAGLDPESKVAKGNDVGVCVDASWNRSTAHVGIGGVRKDGGRHVGIVASRAGLDWVIPWLQSDEAPPGKAVAVQANGPAGTLVKGLRDAGFEVVEWAGAELGRGTGAFYDGVRAWMPEDDDGDADAEPATRIYHRAQPLLDLAAATAVPKMLDGGSMVWDRKKSPVDASPLVAVTGALWVLDHLPEESPPPDIF